MNVTTFLRHHSINCNPFMDEEARHDDVFARLGTDTFHHADMPKVLGDLKQPASAVVFGEKGSGKTAIALQLEEAVARFNEANPDRKVLLIAYDDLNPVLDRFARRTKSKQPADTLKKLTLNDHIDGILSMAVPDLVDAALEWIQQGRVEAGTGTVRRLGGLDRSILRRVDTSTKRDWLILQALYDRPEQVVERGRSLRRRMHVWKASRVRPLRWLCAVLWITAAALGAWYALFPMPEPAWLLPTGLITAVLLAAIVSVGVVVDWARLDRIARRLSAQLKVLDRRPASFRGSLERLPQSVFTNAALPIDELDETRYEMLTRLRRAVRPFGYVNLLILIDRIDEPTLVRGEQERMRAVVWPILNNKFLQQPHFAVKMMLPIELRYSLYGQGRDFFQEARLDKQNMIERLQWSGTTLYDLCNRRIDACSGDGQAPGLRDLFDESVTREDIIAALDQMRQPRDAFKLVYRTIQQHCENRTEDQDPGRIERHTLDQVLAQQKERLDALRGGLGPA